MNNESKADEERRHRLEVESLVAQLRAIDDIMFRKLCENIAFVEEILRVILEDDKITVVEVIPQNSLQNLRGRSVILDAYCKLGNGSYCNVEVQRSDSDDHFRRVRYHAACITANVVDPGEQFEQVDDLVVVYISEFDPFDEGRTVYHVRNMVEETGRAVLDGLREIYVNTKYNDGSEIAELMQCLLEPVVTNPKFPALAQELQAEKGNVKGDESMCKLVEEYAQKRAKEYGEQQKAEGLIEGRKEGIKEGKTAGTLETLVSLVKEKSLDPVAAARKANMSESEFMKLVQG
ncbi:MAG: Rpn family recombination-promoting nuclease/putative transposase [Peptococcaceae bacterium]